MAMSNSQRGDRGELGQGHLDRRNLVAGAGLLGLSLALTACGAGDTAPATPTSGPGAPPVPLEAPAAETDLAKAADIPVGGGAVFPTNRVVVTQPSAGQFKAFSAICSHEGCTINQVADGTINCPCHGSRYSITDGSVVHGPATRPLHTRSITVRDGAVRLSQ
jgi:nitrite reductase/ring-hydroxylating ferredoxin subunit